ncbi:hypothetical protein AEGHOMDF_4000 [Methylobacterium soli]|nr:hypothetical protein AEGHOMDF_4000 [Methylobacterium soli]
MQHLGRGAGRPDGGDDLGVAVTAHGRLGRGRPPPRGRVGDQDGADSVGMGRVRARDTSVSPNRKGAAPVSARLGRRAQQRTVSGQGDRPQRDQQQNCACDDQLVHAARQVRPPAGPAPGQARDAPASACRKECGGSAGTLDDGVVGNSGIAEETRRRSYHSFRVGQSDRDPANQAFPSARANTASQQVEIPAMDPSNDQNLIQSWPAKFKTSSQEPIIFARHDLLRSVWLTAFRP